MFDIGGWELLVIAALALIVVGPKDLPKLIRSVGQWVGRARSLAADFQRGMDNAAREADLADETKSLRNIGSGFTDSLKRADRELRDVSSGARPAGPRGAIEDATARRAASSPRPAAPSKTGPVGPAPSASSNPSPSPSASQPTARPVAEDSVLRDFERGMRDDA